MLAIGLVVTLIAGLLLITSGGNGGSAGVGVLEPEVDVRIGEQGFRSARDGDQLAKGDVARTDDSGQAELTWWEGSVTRLDVKTTFEIGELVDDPGQRVADGKLEVGRVWNRVAKLSNSEERFEIKTHNATAAVRGTAFIVDCRFLPNCTFSVIEGSVLVVTSSGERILLNAGESVTVRRDGSLGDRKTFDIEDLMDDPWVVANLERDEDTRVLAADESNDADAATEAQDEDSDEGDATEDGNEESGDNGGTRPTSFARDVDGPAPGPDPSENDPDDDPDAGNDGNDGNDGPGNGGGGGGGDGPGRGVDEQLTVRIGGVGSGSVTGPGIDCPGDCTALFPRGEEVSLEAIADDGSRFDGWSGDCSGQRCDLTMNGDRDVRARFATGSASTDSGSIAYTRFTGATISEIRIIDADGSNDRLLTPGSMASWAPDGQRIVFQVTGDLWIINVDGTGETQLTSGSAIDVEPDWSPDGSEIAFDRDGDLYAIGADGSGLRLISDEANLGVSGRSPSWAPDGSEIAFMRGDENDDDLSGTSGIFVIGSDGAGALRLTDGGLNGSDHSYPDWSPNGSEVTYVSGPRHWNACQNHVRTIGANGTQDREIIDGPCYDLDPSYSPAGDAIVFSSENPAEGTSEITAVGVDGSSPRVVVSGDVGQPAWGPAPTTTQHALAVTLSGNGSGAVSGPNISCPPDCTASYDEGTEVTLTASPDAGSTFEGFSGDCTGSTCELTMDAAKQVTATFSDAGSTSAATERVSVGDDGSQADDRSLYSAISADGRFVAFDSDATNLIPGTTLGPRHIYVRDTTSDETTLVTEGFHPAMSRNARFVLFSSNGTDLVPGDTNGLADGFIHDRQTGETERFSVASGGTQQNGNGVFEYSVSDDGRFIAFASDATNLVPGDTNGVRDIFVRDRQSGETTRVSVASDGSQATGGNGSHAADISGDGRLVAFSTSSTNLDPAGPGAFVHDRQTGDTVFASVSSSGVKGSGGDLEISRDGRYLTFSSTSTALVDNDTNGVTDVFHRDLQTGETERVSVDGGGSQANGASFQSRLSDDGRFVAFASQATDLVPSDSNGEEDIFVHDVVTGDTWRASVSPDDTEGEGESLDAQLSGNGQIVSFTSSAPNLVADDTNGVDDIFIRELAADGV